MRRLETPVSEILETSGMLGLERLAGIGPSLARTIRDIVTHGYSPILERLRGATDPVRLFASVPGIGFRLAARLHDELGLDTLYDLEAAAHDGRLEEIVGFGSKRLTGIRDTLACRLARTGRAPSDTEQSPPPDVRELLHVDREYREKVRAHALPLIAPRRFNPERAAWLPVLHTERDDRHYTALFSNTARAHRLGRTDDWVVLYCDDGPREHQWTIVTARNPPLQGQRIVRGREAECATFYGASKGAPATDTLVAMDASIP